MGRESVLRSVLALCIAIFGVAVVLGLLGTAQGWAYAAASQPAEQLSSRAYAPDREPESDPLDAPLANGSGASGALTVCKATCPYTHPQDAVYAADDGDIILVASGTYTNSDDTAYVLEITETLTLRGGYTTTDWTRSDPDANPTILDGEGITRVLHVADSSPTVEGFHIYNGRDETSGGGVFVVNGAEPMLQRNRIYSNTAGRGGGIYLSGQSPDLKNNLIYSNTATTFPGGGVYVADGNPLLQHNTFYSNYASNSGGGIYISGGTPVIRATIIVSNSADSGGGIYNENGSPVLNYNDYWGNAGGNWNTSVSTGTESISADPLLVDPARGDFHLQLDSPCKNVVPITQSVDQDYGDRVRPFGEQADIGAYEFYTGTCFALARIEGGTGVYTNVQDAVDAASDDDVVKVAGTCRDVFTRTNPSKMITQVVYIDQDLTLRGGYTITNWDESNPVAWPTTLDADKKGRVIYIENSDATIEYFRITGGQVPTDTYGGGVYIANGSPTLSHNDVFSNVAVNDPAGANPEYGGGIYVGGGSPTLYDNDIYSNTAEFGAGIGNREGSPTVDDCRIGGNDSKNEGGGIYQVSGEIDLISSYIYNNIATNFGGGVAIAGGDATIRRDSAIYANKAGEGADDGGGGVYIKGSASVVLRESRVYSNTAYRNGGGIWCKGTLTLLDSEIYSNTAGYRGGGLYSDVGDITVQRNAFYQNTSENKGGGIYLHIGSDEAVIEDNLIYENNAKNNTGAGINAEKMPVKVVNNTIYNNNGEGVRIYLKSATIRSNIIVSNTDVGVYRESDRGEANVSYSDVWGNEGGNYGGDESPTIDSSTVITSNPEFVSLNPASPNFLHLKSNSPCIDAADPNNYPAIDFDGRSRPFGPAPDMGAIEHYTGTCFAQIDGATRVYSTVHSAIISATAGDTVKVAGTCTETVTISDELTLQGAYTDGESIDGHWITPTTQTILDGSGGGGPVLTITGTNPVTVDRFVIRSATNGGGISVTASLSPTVQNVILHGNQGGGFRSEGGGRLYNNTVVSNSGDGLTFAAGAPVVSNTIVVSNTGDAIATTNPITLAYSNVWGNTGCDWGCDNTYSDTHSLSVNPQFRGPEAGDFQLGLDSPCVNVGDPNTALAWDFEGSERPLPEDSDDYDIGADEGDRYYGVRFTTLPPQTRWGDPDAQVVHRPILTNTGSEVVTFTLADTLDVITGTEAGWDIDAPSEIDDLQPNEGRTIPVTVTIPGEALKDDTAIATITATLKADASVQAVVTNTTVVSLSRDVSLTPRSPSESVNPGETYVYEHTLTNLGNTEDTFEIIKLDDTYAWATVSPTEKTLGPGASTPVFVTVTVPLTMPSTDPAGPVIPGQTVITVTNNDPDLSAWDTVTDTTAVNNPPRDRYVSADGTDGLNNCSVYTNPCGTIAQAVGQATNNDTIKVKMGTLSERNINVNKDVTIRGGYGGDWSYTGTLQTTVDAGQDGRIFQISADPLIEGFTLQHADAAGSGGAVYIQNADPTLRRNTIRYNNAVYGGGVYNSVGDPVIERNEIYSNTANYGGGFASRNGDPSFWNNMVYDNLALIDDGIPSRGGGVYVEGGEARIWHDTLYANAADEGGGIYLDATASVVSNTIIAQNTAMVDGSGVYSNAPAASFAYNDIWNDSYVGLSVSDIYTTVDPSFEEPDVRDLHLASDSPLIDLGDGTHLTSDVDGDPRDAEPDVGADEYMQYGVIIAPDRSNAGQPGQEISYEHTVTNTGNYTDTFVVDSVSEYGWTVAPNPTELEIGPGESETVQVNVIIDDDAVEGTVDTTVVTVTYKFGPDKSDTVEDTTTVERKCGDEAWKG